MRLSVCVRPLVCSFAQDECERQYECKGTSCTARAASFVVVVGGVLMVGGWCLGGVGGCAGGVLGGNFLLKIEISKIPNQSFKMFR